jgi:hypothetical protein
MTNALQRSPALRVALYAAIATIGFLLSEIVARLLIHMA